MILGKITCQNCQKEFETPIDRATVRKYCSRECARNNLNERMKAKKIIVTKKCPICEKEFISKKIGLTRQKYCSTTCMRKGYRLAFN